MEKLLNLSIPTNPCATLEKMCPPTDFIKVFQRHTTAMVTAGLAKVTVHKKIKGVVFPFEITDMDEILSEINCKDIVLKEFITR